MSNFSEWVKKSYTVKFGLIGILVLLLLIPASMVEELIYERQNNSEQVNLEVGSKWGYAQTLTGPVINLPYKAKFKSTNEKGETIYTDGTGTLHFLPENLTITNKVKTETRYRGIYKAVVYSDEAVMEGNFGKIDFAQLNIPAESILWEQAYLSLPVSDLRGIKNRVMVQWNDDTLEMQPGIADNDILINAAPRRIADAYNEKPVLTSGVSAAASSGLSASVNIRELDRMNFRIPLQLNGSAALWFIPTGKETNIHIESSYPDPGFDGAFLPDKHDIRKDGFSANWKIFHLNRNFPQAWANNAFDMNAAGFGVQLLVPADHYQKSMRSAKYAIMFIVLTFLVFVFSEILNRYSIHPVQYLLIGLALVLFYTLLLSLSEQIGFTGSYIVSSLAIIGLITLYSKTIFSQNKMVAVLAGILIILYGFLFIVLRSEDYALLLGSIGLFIVLAIVMYLSRKVQWYGNIDKES